MLLLYIDIDWYNKIMTYDLFASALIANSPLTQINKININKLSLRMKVETKVH